MEKELSLEFLRTVETAAIASARTMGQGDRSGSDQAAVEAMRSEMDRVGMDGTIVIGEGERDEAPMLFIGEKVGAAVTTKPHLSASGYRRGPAGGHESLRHRRRRAQSWCWPPANTAACSTRRISTWKNHCGASGERRDRSRRAGEGQPPRHCPALRSRRRRSCRSWFWTGRATKNSSVIFAPRARAFG